MAFYLPGIHVPHRKNTIKQPTVQMNTPKSVTIPMSMHIGKPSIPTVKVGDLVKVGTKIADADGLVSSCVYSGISGKVTKIEEYILTSGTSGTAVVIESDGEMTVDEAVCPPVISSKDEFIDAIKQSGIVGL